ncbi:hypothetical protein ABZ609_00435 [Streptomyces rubiginosohelvolus]|uniref:hypothetical protein n=1 Tax=Streptomyces rubiginosohelvolus TaxID=67362 RepID=UPI0033DF6054
MTEVPAGELMIVRFSPFSEEKIMEKAQRDHGRLQAEGKHPIYAISTFGIVRPDYETSIDDLIETICKTAPVNGKKAAVTTRQQLQDQGFRVERSEPPLHHHDVILGNELNETDVKRLAALLAAGSRRNLSWPSK